MSKLIDAEFAKAMEGHQYGTEETRDAKDWFFNGWSAFQNHLHDVDPGGIASVIQERDALEQTLQSQPPLDETVQIGQSCRVYAVEYVDKLKLDSEVACADVHAMRQEIEQHHAAHHELQQRLARVYDERNALVISLARLALAAGYKAGWGTDSNEQNDPEWRTVVYAQFDGVQYINAAEPYTGPTPMQLSWHMAPDWQTAAQANLPAFDGQWDGSFLGREPANYVGQVPIVPHLSQVHSVTIDADKFSAAEIIAAFAPSGNGVMCGQLVPAADYDKVQKAASRLKTLIDLCGHVQNGSDTTVRLFQDDATGECFVRIGNAPSTRSWWGASFGEAIDQAEKDRAKWEQS